MTKTSTIEEFAIATVNDLRWASLIARSLRSGKFYYSVKTTGVYCRPSCAARLARRRMSSSIRPAKTRKSGLPPMQTSQAQSGRIAKQTAGKIARLAAD